MSMVYRGHDDSTIQKLAIATMTSVTIAHSTEWDSMAVNTASDNGQ